jgi:hypothetical protein
VYPAHGALVSLGGAGVLGVLMAVRARQKRMEGNARSWLCAEDKSILGKMAQSHDDEAQRF